MRSRVMSDQVTAVLNAAILFGLGLALHLPRPWALAEAGVVYLALTVAFVRHRRRAHAVLRFPQRDRAAVGRRGVPSLRRRSRRLHAA